MKVGGGSTKFVKSTDFTLQRTPNNKADKSIGVAKSETKSDGCLVEREKG